MNVIMYAYAVDKLLIYKRSEMSNVQKNISDQIIIDHYNVKSSIEDCAKIINTNLKELDNS